MAGHENTDHKYRPNPLHLHRERPRKGLRTPLNYKQCSEQRDGETGYSYFGARYYDSETSGLWLSVDPMADKYPGISPYAYCAWNPVKLVDPDGREIDISSLTEKQQVRLVECLSKVTGLSLFVDNGKLNYDKSFSSSGGSQKARNDLIKAIDDETFITAVFESNYGNSKREKGTMLSVNNNNVTEIKFDAAMGVNFNSNQDDFSTYGLSMEFMHELLHCYYNYKDPTARENNTTFRIGSNNQVIIARPIEKTISFFFGRSVVGRVNEYRNELGFDSRVTYASLDIGTPFRDSKGHVYWINPQQISRE